MRKGAVPLANASLHPASVSSAPNLVSFSHMRSEWLILIFILWSTPLVGATLEHTASTPLNMEGETRSRIDQALMELSRGNASYFETLTAADFLTPSARPSAHAEDVFIRWTHIIPQVLERLSPEQKNIILSRLDAHFMTLRSTAENPVALACAFIPAPSAVKEVQRAANHAFDHGRFADFLGLAYFLPDQSDERLPIAQQLIGWGAQVDPAWQLTTPGLPQLTEKYPTPAPLPTRGVRWDVVPGWLFARDPFAQIIWQYRIDRNATTLIGPHVVFVRDSMGSRIIDKNATIRPLPPLPSDTQALGLSDTAGWFVAGKRVWHFALTDGTVSEVVFPEPPIGAPLLRANNSLWLTEHELILLDGERITQRVRHQLPAENTWRLAFHETTPLIVGDNNQHWLIPSLSEQTTLAHSAETLAALLAAQSFTHIISATKNISEPFAQSFYVRAHIGLALQHKDQSTLHQLSTSDVRDKALLLSAQLSLLDPQKNYRFSPTHNEARQRDLYQEMDAFCQQQPQALLTSDADNLLDPENLWSHQMSATAWTAWRLYQQQILTEIPAQIQVHADATIIAPPSATTTATRRNEQGDIVLENGVLRLQRTHDLISLSLVNSAQQVLWRQRWRSRAFITVPSLTMDVHDGFIFVYEIGLRLTVLDPHLGLIGGQYELNELNGIPYFLTPNTLAIIAPLGIQNTLTWFHNDQSSEEPLPIPARWACVVPATNGISATLIMRDQEKNLWRFPGKTPLAWPNQISQLLTAPEITPAGVRHDHMLWEWVR
jgi:hypothetical protein